MNQQIQEVEQTPNSIKLKKSMPRYIIVRSLKIKHRKKKLKAEGKAKKETQIRKKK